MKAKKILKYSWGFIIWLTLLLTHYLIFTFLKDTAFVKSFEVFFGKELGGFNILFYSILFFVCFFPITLALDEIIQERRQK